LIQEAIDHGDTDIHTMEVADYWLLVSIYFFAEKISSIGMIYIALYRISRY